MESMVSSVESPWRKMESAVESMKNTLFVVYALIAFIWAVELLLLFSGRFDVGGWLLALFTLALGNALYALHRFSEGAIERIRRLSASV